MNESDDPVEIRFVGPGWADLILRMDDGAYTLKSISYTTDAVGDLVRFALAIATGSEYQTVSFDLEPVELRLVAHSMFDTQSRKGPVQISVYGFPDMQLDKPVSDGQFEFAGSCQALDFAKAVSRTAKNALQYYEEGKWGTLHAPPTAALRALEAALIEA